MITNISTEVDTDDTIELQKKRLNVYIRQVLLFYAHYGSSGKLSFHRFYMKIQPSFLWIS